MREMCAFTVATLMNGSAAMLALALSNGHYHVVLAGAEFSVRRPIERARWERPAGGAAVS
jgi:hypothetical protein